LGRQILESQYKIPPPPEFQTLWGQPLQFCVNIDDFCINIYDFCVNIDEFFVNIDDFYKDFLFV